MMKKSSVSTQNLGSFPSPGAPNYRDKSHGSQKGWSSERVPQPASSNRRHTSVSGLSPFNSGRTLPSKWDEAERWICSPVSASANNNSKSSHGQFQRRPKSKSGPIVPPGIAYYSNDSPAVPQLEGVGIKKLMVGSPFSTGVLAPDAVSVHHYNIDNRAQYSCLTRSGSGVAHLSSAPRCSEVLCDPSSPYSQDEKDDRTKDENAVISLDSKRDKATQMSPESEKDSHSTSISSPSSSINQQSYISTKLEVRDVQVDSQATAIRWSKRFGTKLTEKDLPHSKDFSESSTEAQASSCDIAEPTMNTSKMKREEAKIIAWENLQKAKAEAAIRKLEMKLEKKRSSSMDKILNKLRGAQMKAEKMRSLTAGQEGDQVSRNCKVFPFSKYNRVWSPGSCFGSHVPTCEAYRLKQT